MAGFPRSYAMNSQKAYPPRPRNDAAVVTLLYVCRDGQSTEGPFPADQVFRMVRSGQLDPAVMCCIAGGDVWKPFDSFPVGIFSKRVMDQIHGERVAAADWKEAWDKLGTFAKVVGFVICFVVVWKLEPVLFKFLFG